MGAIAVAGFAFSGMEAQAQAADPEVDVRRARAAAERAAEGLPEHIRVSLVHPDRPPADKLRDISRQPGRVLDFFGVEAGDRVLNVVGRDGYYAEIVARVVGADGQVIFHNSIDWANYLNADITKRLVARRLPRLVHYVAERNHLGIPEHTVDVALCIRCYHETYFVEHPNPDPGPDEFSYVDPDLFLAGIYDALKPGGVFGLVDHQALEGSGRAAGRTVHRINDELVREELEAAGFEFVGSSDFLRNPEDDNSVRVFSSPVWENTDRWVMLFRKPGPG